jgi:hypothetical protein
MSEEKTEGSEPELTEEQRVLKENAGLIAELTAKHGRIGIFYNPWEFEGLLIVGRPEPKSYREYMALVATAMAPPKPGVPRADIAIATLDFATKSVVHPGRDAAKKLLERLPALANIVSNKAGDLAGNDTQELGKG